jgi:serine incorporator 1/3
MLGYNAVSKNPNATCNPRLGELSPLRITFGLAVTLLSLAWTGWSYTAADKWSNTTAAPDPNPDVEADDAPNDGRKKVTGVVVSGAATNDTDGTSYGAVVEDDDSKNDKANGASAAKSNDAWKLNVALAAMSCWSAMVLTEWGQIQSNGTVANPTLGLVSMWVIIGSQWFFLSLYIWTLVAPRLFPNRDFS